MQYTIQNGEPVIGAGVGFERIRRITGYLVDTVDRFNNAKRAEEHDRVKHTVSLIDGGADNGCNDRAAV